MRLHSVDIATSIGYNPHFFNNVSSPQQGI